MRVLLIDPPYERFIGFRSEWFPMGIAYIGAYLKQRGHNVGVYNAEHDSEGEYKSVVKYANDFNKYKTAVESSDHPIWKEIIAVIRTFRPDLIGISTMTPKIPSALRVCALAKGIDQRIITILGGHHPTMRPEKMLEDRNVDFAIRGEGEATFAELLEHLAHNDPALEDIPGLSFKQNGAIINNQLRGLISDLGSLPMPGRDLLINLNDYTPVQLGMVITSRGCPFDCGFCASKNMWSRKVRFRPIKDVLAEIREMKERHGVRNVMFMDDSFTVNRARIVDLCNGLIDNKIDITWSCLTRVDMVTPEMIALMKKAGCRKVDVGIESGSDRVLKLIGKEITLGQVRKAARILNRQKMFWSAFFMIGFPTETEGEIGDTIRLLKEIRPDWANISIFTPYPGTVLYELAMEVDGFSKFCGDYTLYSHQSVSRRWTDTIPKERFGPLAERILAEVHAYNSSFKCLAKRALARDYCKNPRLLLLDIKKVVSWLKK